MKIERETFEHQMLLIEITVLEPKTFRWYRFGNASEISGKF